MPKMKTKSGAKKRFKLTASGKVKAVLKECDAKVVRKKFMPNG